jgi:hypothetical protein
VSKTFVSDSTWADQRCESWTSTQHYIDLPISLDGTPTNGVPNDPTNVVTAIQQHIVTLQNPNASLSTQATALRYLLHFVGDIQQPLHCAAAVWASNTNGDAGGNQFYLNGTWSQLHSLWDAGGGYLGSGASVSSNASEVEALYPYSKTIGSIPNPMDWAVEGQEIARTNTYVGVTLNGTPSAAYLSNVQATTKQRMAIGGQRLAKLLNTIFVTNIPVVATANITSGNFGFSWGSVSGRTYRVQWKDQLTDAVWSNLTDVTASGNLTSFSESATGKEQRFYRAIVVH